MNAEMKSIKDFRVYLELMRINLSASQRYNILKSRWVLRWKGCDVKARSVVK